MAKSSRFTQALVIAAAALLLAFTNTIGGTGTFDDTFIGNCEAGTCNDPLGG